MVPKIAVVSDSDNFLDLLVKYVANMECGNFFTTHIGKSQSEQKKLVSAFQLYVMSELRSKIAGIVWSLEHQPNKSSRDSIDIFGDSAEFSVIIEIDKNRADQVAKKFVSRMALVSSKKVYFLSLCYPGTENMNKLECIKYFGYCSALALRMGCHYAGFTIESRDSVS